MDNELIVFNRPKANISEDIRTIRTNLKFSSSVQDSKIVLITSSVPGEGKSFISSNLACAFAQNGEKTLLIDCDLRLGRVHKIFNISNSDGLSKLLISDDIASVYKKYIKKTDIPKLSILTAGFVPPNPSELLNSNNMKTLIKTLRKDYEHIIFDGVPVNGLPDSLIMAKLVDRVVVVTSIGTDISELNDTKKALENIGAKVAGVVVNKVNKSKKDKYYSYYEER